MDSINLSSTSVLEDNVPLLNEVLKDTFDKVDYQNCEYPIYDVFFDGTQNAAYEQDVVDFVNAFDPSLHTPEPLNKVFVEVLSSSNNFESNSPVPIPGMVATVPADGDYVFTSRLNIKPDKDDTMNFYYSKNGINSASRIDSSKFNCSSKKNKDSGVEFSYPLDGLSQGDQIYLLVDTDGEDVDFDERYIRGESWG